MKDMHFVALDLETTGLNPQEDTIIEIACVRFSITQKVQGTFDIVDVEERNMLVYPGFDISTEVTMITNITNDMLKGRKSWQDIREKVQDFIGDAVIVGHNVLFDIAVLKEHGIDISGHKIIDTFELSEIFSQDIKSLNLGFLAKSYDLLNPDDVEHRALTDTKITVRLLLHYLGCISNMNSQERHIWNLLALKDSSNTLNILTEICHIPKNTSIIPDLFEQYISKKIPTNTNLSDSDSGFSSPIYKSIDDSKSSEIQLIKQTFDQYKNIEIVVPNKKMAQYMLGITKDLGISSIIQHTPAQYLSVTYLQDTCMSDEVFSRKKIILLVKLVFWMMQTKTGLLEELKFYGEEREMLGLFRLDNKESNIWYDAHNTHLLASNCRIVEISNICTKKSSTHQRMIKDLPLIGNIVRRKNTQKFSFQQARERLQLLHIATGENNHLIRAINMLEHIEGIYLSIPDRPNGPQISPPGDYGETYHMTQKKLWYQGSRWLIYTTHTLMYSWNTWLQSASPNTLQQYDKHIQAVCSSLEYVQSIHTQKQANIELVLHITQETLVVFFVPKNIAQYIKPIISHSLAYGIHIFSAKTQQFIESNYGIKLNGYQSALDHKQKIPSIVYQAYKSVNIIGGTVVITTSRKNARDLGQILRKRHPNKTIIIQGLSGGKAKMLATFLSEKNNTILVGLIDTWRDEIALWQAAKHIHIIKMPFDPLTDPYFLVQTAGMKNNFLYYSEPMMIIRINTLIARIRSSGFDRDIYTSDARLYETEWGKRILSELL